MLGPFARCLSILIYHRVVPRPDPLFPEQVCEREFDRQMAALARWFTVLPLPEAIRKLRAGALPARAACVTFDDGYADNVTIALPVLRRWQVPATFFLATDYIDGGLMWNDTVIEAVRSAPGDTLDARSAGLGSLPTQTAALRRGAIDRLLERLKYLPPEERQQRVDELSGQAGGRIPRDLMVTSAQVRRLCEDGMTVGAHTLSHPILAKIGPERAGIEIGESRRRLEAITAAPVTLFAYPNGTPGRDYGREHVAMVKELGFEAAVSTAWGVSRAGSDLFQLPRFTPWDKNPGRFLVRLVQNTFRTSPERV